MQTVTDNLQAMAAEVQELLQTLLLQHSSLYYRNNEVGPFVLISPHGDFSYNKLPEAGRQVQTELLEKYRHLSALLKTLLREQPKDVLKQLADAETVLLRTIEQQSTWCKTTNEALTKATEALQLQCGLIGNLYNVAAGAVVYVPDTNALLYNPQLAYWQFADAPTFALVLIPTVLSELDALKINHRNEGVRQKAEALINQIKEFRRRGKLSNGVPLVKGQSTIRSMAIEPNMQTTLPWLDADNNDDRFLAATIEVMRLHPQSAVLAVSRDINLQNKAEFAGVPVVEPPEPPSAS